MNTPYHCLYSFIDHDRPQIHSWSSIKPQGESRHVMPQISIPARYLGILWLLSGPAVT